MIAPNPEIVWLALAAFFLPFVSFLISIAFPARYSWIAPLGATVVLLASTLFSVMLFSRTWNETPVIFHFPWFTAGTHAVQFGFKLDNVSTLMVLTVSVISFLVHLYSIGYMAGEQGVRRYFALLGFFTFSMVGLVMASNLLVVFAFWEFVGVSSYLLIGFRQEKPEATVAATKAFLMNRIGDLGLFVGVIMLWAYKGTLDFDGLLSSSVPIAEPTFTLIGLCIFLGVIGKSAQFPLFSWLPDAMEGPTPVSALIHAATMVAAGVFLIGRIYFLFSPDVLRVMAIVGVTTAVMGALMALVHFDIKRILAYSTISQLGWMVVCLGAGDPSASQLHLVTHAFFKACLFLSAGAVIHILQQASHQSRVEMDVQDIRQLGGLAGKMPFVFLAFAVSACSLAGVPLFSGFLSKDAILTSIQTPVFLVLGLIVAFLTVVYTFRLVWFVFFGQPRGVKKFESIRFPIAPWVMRIPFLLLAAASTWPIVSKSPIQFNGWLFSGLHQGKYFHFSAITILSAGVVFTASAFSYFFYRSRAYSSGRDRFDLVRNNFGLDRLYAKGIVEPVLMLSTATSYIDKKWIDGLLHFNAYIQVTLAHLAGWCDKTIVDGVGEGVAKIVNVIGSVTRSLANGKIQSYILWALAGLIVFMVWILYK